MVFVHQTDLKRSLLKKMNPKCPKCGSEVKVVLNGKRGIYTIECLSCDHKSEDKELNKAYYRAFSAGEET
jgi:uncharacterized metal-binding protein (TIGR02443 family)